MAAKANRKRADLQFGTRTRVRPNPVTGNQRPIGRRVYPFIFARGGKTNRPANVGQSRDAGRRIGGGHAAGKQRGETDDRVANAAQVETTSKHGEFSSFYFPG